jgi:ribosomal protein S18 acetylase RimI-like enzyme
MLLNQNEYKIQIKDKLIQAIFLYFRMVFKVKIRDAVTAERSTLVKFMAELQEFERELDISRSEGIAIANAHFAYLEKLVKENSGRIFVAESPEGLLGFIVCFVEEIEQEDLHIIEAERRFGYISDLYVSPVARKKGVATALIESAESHFQELRLKVIKVTTLYHNHQAQILYERSLYKPYEVVYQKRLSNNS